MYSFKETDMFVRMRHKAILTAYPKMFKFLSTKFNGIHNLNPTSLPATSLVYKIIFTHQSTHGPQTHPFSLSKLGRSRCMQENPSLFFFIIKMCVAVKIQVKNSHSKIFSSLFILLLSRKRQ